ncbi:MAG: ATP-binding protein [Planctomycetota bacterium]
MGGRMESVVNELEASARGLGTTGLTRVLLIEDDPADARLVELCLDRAATRCAFSMEHQTRIADGIEAARATKFDVILLDLSLPDGVGLDNLERLLVSVATVPIVVLTGCDDEAAADEALRAGAQDFLVKGAFDRRGLLNSIRHSIQRHRLVQEVTEARRRETEVRNELLSHVSHELRTPLTAVLQFVTILQDGIGGEVSPQQAEYLGIIQRNSEQLKFMIGELMDATRAETGRLIAHKTVVDLVPALEAAVEDQRLAAEERGVALSLRSVPSLRIIADPTRLAQVIANLLGNALKFTPADGRIEVSAEIDPGNPLLARIAVRDTGCGIPADDVPHVFDRLYQSRSPDHSSRRGLGLGLHISREIVRQHGGEIHVESREGRGSCFRFTMPVYSLDALIQRFVPAVGQPPSEITLIAAQAWPSGPAANAKTPALVLTELQRLVADCILGVCDVVLPSQVGRGCQTVFAVARTGLEGATAIRERIRGALGANDRLRRWGFSTDVSSHAFGVVAAEDAVGELSDELTAAMRSIKEAPGGGGVL